MKKSNQPNNLTGYIDQERRVYVVTSDPDGVLKRPETAKISPEQEKKAKEVQRANLNKLKAIGEEFFK
jgi:hypothetical protein